MLGKQMTLANIPMSGLKRLILILVCGFSLPAAACLPQVNWNDTISFCSGNSVTLSAFNPNASYYWSTGQTSASITVSTSGQYWVEVTNTCGSVFDTIQIIVDNPVWVNLGNDRAVCSPGNTILTAPNAPGADYIWQDGSRGQSFTVTQSGTYWVQVSNGCGVFSDTVNISYQQPPTVNLGGDVNLCQPGTTTLQSSNNPQGSYQWNTGDTTSSITTNQPGTYWLRVTNACGTNTDTVNFAVQQGQVLDIGDTVYACPNGTVVLRSNLGGGSYNWSTSATTRSVTVGNQGLYWLQFTDNCGTYTDSVYVQYSGKAVVDLGPDTTVCVKDNYTLDAGNLGSTYQWQDNSTGRTYAVQSSGTFWVAVNNGCGLSYDSVEVTLLNAPNPQIKDTVYYCSGDSVTVDAGFFSKSTTYLWRDNSTGQVKDFYQTGLQWVDVMNQCDTVRDTFYVEPSQNLSFDIGPDTMVCAENYSISTGISGGGVSFNWSNGSGDPGVVATQSGIYWVVVTNACGQYTDTMDLELVREPGLVGGKNKSFCTGGSLQLNAVAQPFTSYQWSTGDTTSSITVAQPGNYWVHTYNICDTVTDTAIVTRVNPIPVDLGKDTTICRPNSIFLDVSQYAADSVRWSTNSTNGGLPVARSGQYWVQLFNACGVYSDTINITVKRPPQKILQNTFYCTGASTMLNASQSQVNSYQWNTGDTTSSISVSSQGWYYVTMSNECGTVVDSAYVYEDQPIPGFDLGNDTIFCQGTLTLVPYQSLGVSYRWQDGSTSSTYTVTKTGMYSVTVSNTCNSVTDSIMVMITGPPKFVLGSEVKLCNGTILNLNARNPGSRYLWNTGDSTQILPIDTAGKYWVTITNNCGQLTDTVDVVVEYSLAGFSLGEDTTICKGQQLLLNPDVGKVTTEWSNGSTDTVISVSQAGSYWVRVRNSCGRWYDTINVQVLDVPVFSLGPDQGICADSGSVTLEGPPGMFSYEWSNGDTSLNSTFYSKGKKWLTLSNGCFNYTDTIGLIEEYPIEIELGPDTAFCFGQSYTLNSNVFDYTVIWDDNTRGSSREVTRSGTFWAVASNSCGVFYDSVVVEFHRPIEEETIDTVICNGDSVRFDFTPSGHKITWADGSVNPVRVFYEDGRYPFIISNKCGDFRKVLDIDFTNCQCPVHIANAFTPNGDGINDFFAPVFDCSVKDYQLEIFDRWGMEVFSTRNINHLWDGDDRRDRPVGIGTYNYRLYYSFEVYGNLVEREKRGVINVLR